MDDQLKTINSTPGVGGVRIWVHYTGDFLGCLLDRYFKEIPGSTCWSPYPTVQEVVDSLERAAATLRRRAEHA